jgi:hypothetical protein
MSRPTRRKAIEPAIFWAVLDARGPSDLVKMVWLQLWSYRDALDQIRHRTQAGLAELLGCSERTLHRRLGEAVEWGMITDHAGAWGGPSFYHVRPPHLWFTEPQPDRRALRPPRPVEARTAVDLEPPVCDVSQ